MKTQEQRNALIYIRVASVPMRDPYHAQNEQEAHCHQFADRHNLRVVAVFCDHGRTDGPDGLPRSLSNMLAYLDAHRGENYVVLTDDVARLGRRVERNVQVRAAIQAAGASLIVPTGVDDVGQPHPFNRNLIANARV
jgi:DNA invertase Pin-like site-specific DNA recombinase